MFELCYSSAWVPGTQQRRGQLCLIQNALTIVIFVVLSGLWSGPTLHAQSGSVHWTEANDFRVGYQLSTASATLLPNEQFSINLYLETLPGIECFGANFNLWCSPQVTHLQTNSHSLPSSGWLGSSIEVSSVLKEKPGCKSINWTIYRNDQVPRSGAGWVLTANFEVGNAPISADKVVQQLSGGLIIVENIDMKRFHSEEVIAELKCFPNPFIDRIQVEFQGKRELQCRVVDLKGQLVHQVELDSQGELQLAGLAPGMYFLMIRLKGERKSRALRIIKK